MFKFSTAGALAICAASTALVNGGTVEIYDGAPVANADTPITTQVLLASFLLADPAYQDPTDFGTAARAVANVITGGVPVADGTAAWFFVKDSVGSIIWMGDCGVVGSGAQMEMETLDLLTSQPITISLAEYFQPKE